jgi:hypothetical protein
MAPVFFPLHNNAVRRPLLNLTFIFPTNHLTAANTFWGIEVAFATLLNRFPNITLEPSPIVWRENLGLRGFKGLQAKVAADQ